MREGPKPNYGGLCGLSSCLISDPPNLGENMFEGMGLEPSFDMHEAPIETYIETVETVDATLRNERESDDEAKKTGAEVTPIEPEDKMDGENKGEEDEDEGETNHQTDEHENLEDLETQAPPSPEGPPPTQVPEAVLVPPTRSSPISKASPEDKPDRAVARRKVTFDLGKNQVRVYSAEESLDSPVPNGVQRLLKRKRLQVAETGPGFNASLPAASIDGVERGSDADQNEFCPQGIQVTTGAEQLAPASVNSLGDLVFLDSLTSLEASVQVVDSNSERLFVRMQHTLERINKVITA